MSMDVKELNKGYRKFNQDRLEYIRKALSQKDNKRLELAEINSEKVTDSDIDNAARAASYLLGLKSPDLVSPNGNDLDRVWLRKLLSAYILDEDSRRRINEAIKSR